MRGGAPSTRAHLPARSSPANPSSIPHFEPPALALEPLLTRENTRRATKNVATGTKCGVLGGASPPPEPADLRRADRRGRSRKQVANRRLHTSGSSSLGLPELKKEFTPPASSIHHWDFGLTRVWFERHSHTPFLFYGLLN